MGLFGFLGKAVKGVAKGLGSVAKVGIGVAKFGLTSGLLPIPGGGLAGKLAGTLLQKKTPMGSTAAKITLRSPILMRGQSPLRYQKATTTTYGGTRPPAPVLRASPVMPGGAVATPSGIASRMSAPPWAYAGAATAGPRKKRRRSKARTSRSSRKKRRSSGRKLKFGSPAWRKKYLKKRRRAA